MNLINTKKGALDGRMYDIVEQSQYDSNRNLFGNTSTAIEYVDPDSGNTYVLPFRNQSDDRPGIYDMHPIGGGVYFTRLPQNEEEKSEYNKDNLEIIDFNNASTMSEMITMKQQLRELEADVLTDVDDVFLPTISVSDTKEMRALKEAVRKKKCDINKYADRFGDNFLNDKRIFRGNSITMNKLISISDKLDMKVEIIISDKDNDVPNPIGEEIHAVLTGEDDE